MYFASITTPAGREIKVGQCWEGHYYANGNKKPRTTTIEVVGLHRDEIRCRNGSCHTLRYRPAEFDERFHTLQSYVDPKSKMTRTAWLAQLAMEAGRFIHTEEMIEMYRKVRPYDAASDVQIGKCFREMIKRQKYTHKILKIKLDSGKVKRVYIRILGIKHDTDRHTVSTKPLREYLETTSDEYTASDLHKKFGVNLTTVYRFMKRYGNIRPRTKEELQDSFNGWTPCEGEEAVERTIARNRKLLNSVFR